MKAEEAAKWMDMLCERSLKMDESGKFDQVAALIRAQAEVVEAAFAALDAARTWEFATGMEPDLDGILDLHRDSEAEARRLRAELEGK